MSDIEQQLRIALECVSYTLRETANVSGHLPQWRLTRIKWDLQMAGDALAEAGRRAEP